MNAETQLTESNQFHDGNEWMPGLLTPELVCIKAYANRAGFMAAVLEGEGVAIFEPVVRATEKGTLPLGYKVRCVRTLHEARSFIKSAVARGANSGRRRGAAQRTMQPVLEMRAQ
jgi:hypothetical protein